jgi:hypothetical protein
MENLHLDAFFGNAAWKSNSVDLRQNIDRGHCASIVLGVPTLYFAV